MTIIELEKRAYTLAQTIRQFGRLQCGRLFGTVRTTEGRYKAMMDLLERCYFMRAELNAIAAILIDKGVVTREEFLTQHVAEFERYLAALRKEWPEIEVSTTGYTIKDVDALQRRTKSESWPP